MDNNKQYIREGQKVTFSAQLEKGDRRLTSWIVYEGNQCDDNHIVKEEKQVGTEFSHIFEKAGEYTIVSYGKRDEINESTAIRAQVEEEFIFEGIECLSPTSICYKEEGVWKVKRKIESREEREERIKNKKREPKEGDVGFQVKFKDNKIPAKLEFKIKLNGDTARIIKKGNAIWYTPVNPNKKGEKFDIIVKFSNTEIIEPMVVLRELPPFENVVDHKNVGVTQITTIPEGIQKLRSKDSLKLKFNPKFCFIAGESIKPSDLIWKLNGNTLLAKGTQIEIPREQIANSKKDNKVEVFKNKTDTKSIASYSFSIFFKNEIIKFDVSETPAFGKEVTFEVKEMIFPKLEANEEIYWEIKKGYNFVARGAGFKFKHLFNEGGDFEVRCYISNKGIVSETYPIVQPKIFTNTAKWIDRDGSSGNVLNKAGYYQKIYAYIEHEGLLGEEVSLFIYDKDTNQLIHTEKRFKVTNKKNICIPFMLKKDSDKDSNKKTKENIQVYFRIKPDNPKLSVKDIDNQKKEYLTITNRGDVVDAYFCDFNDTEIYRAKEVGSVDLHFKLYMTNMLGREVEILFYIFKPYPTAIPAKDCLNWVHWEKIAGLFSKKQPFHTTKTKVNDKGEILVKVPTSKLMQIEDFTFVVAVFKIMGSDGKEKGAYLERGNVLTLFSNNSLPFMEENHSPVKVLKDLLKKGNKNVLRQEIGGENVDDAVIVLTGETTSIGKISKHRGEYYMYKVNIYNGISYETYMKNKEVLEPSDTFELARDAWLINKQPRSGKRYGSRNETPPGIYWLLYNPKGYGEKKHKLKVTDDPNLDEIKGVDGKRTGIRIHSFSPHDAEGCLTTGAEKEPKDGSKSLEDQFIDKIPALKKKPVRFIIEPREVVEEMKTKMVDSEKDSNVKVKITNKIFKGVENKKNK